MSCYIKDLQNEIRELETALSDIHNKIYCIGGPLNDNTLKFNSKQQKWFWNTAKEIEFTLNRKG